MTDTSQYTAHRLKISTFFGNYPQYDSRVGAQKAWILPPLPTHTKIGEPNPWPHPKPQGVCLISQIKYTIGYSFFLTPRPLFLPNFLRIVKMTNS